MKHLWRSSLDDYSSLKAAVKWCPGPSEHGLSFFDKRASYSSSLGTLTILTVCFWGRTGVLSCNAALGFRKLILITFLKNMQFSSSAVIILSSSIPEANKQYITLIFQNQQVLTTQGHTRNRRHFMFFLYIYCFHSPYFHFAFKRHFLHSLQSSSDWTV